MHVNKDFKIREEKEKKRIFPLLCFKFLDWNQILICNLDLWACLIVCTTDFTQTSHAVYHCKEKWESKMALQMSGMGEYFLLCYLYLS